jgi:hypothetical protein
MGAGKLASPVLQTAVPVEEAGCNRVPGRTTSSTRYVFNSVRLAPPEPLYESEGAGRTAALDP